MSYERNIERLSKTSRFNTSQAQAMETRKANQESQWHLKRANQTIDAISVFSETLQKERKKQMRKERNKKEERKREIDK